MKNSSLFILWGWGAGISLSNDIPFKDIKPIPANMYVSLLGYESFLVCELRPTSIVAQTDRMGKRHNERKAHRQNGICSECADDAWFFDPAHR